MECIRFLRQGALDTLREKIKENLSWYRGNDSDPICILDDYGEMSKSVDETCFDTLNANATEDDDQKNVLAIHAAFGNLSLQQATEERIWVYATHVLAKQYVAKRWSKIPEDSEDPKADDKAVQYILKHYFVFGTRGLVRDNAVARLWWMGHLASRCRDYDLKDTLGILLRDSDVRANLIERSSISMSQEMFNGVIRVLGKSLKDSDDPAIYKRINFREFMKTLNRKGGRIMLNMVEPKQLDAILDSIVEKITSSTT